MSRLGTWRASGLGHHSGSLFSQGIIDVTGYRISGLASSNAMACVLVIYSGNTSTGDGYFRPLEVGDLK